MTYLLRKIRKNRWSEADDMLWLPDGELQADTVTDLQTSHNELSVYHIREDESNLDRVLAAVAANSPHLANLDFAIFSLDSLSKLEVNIKRTKGKLPDEKVNTWHSDIYELSSSKLVALARSIKAEARIDQERGARIARKLEKEIVKLVAYGIKEGRIDRARIGLKPKYLDKIDRIIANE